MVVILTSIPIIAIACFVWVPIVQDRAQDSGFVFGETLVSGHRDVPCGVAGPGDKNYRVRDAAKDSRIRHLEHRWSVYDHHVELSLEFRQQKGKVFGVEQIGRTFGRGTGRQHKKAGDAGLLHNLAQSIGRKQAVA